MKFNSVYPSMESCPCVMCANLPHGLPISETGILTHRTNPGGSPQAAQEDRIPNDTCRIEQTTRSTIP